MGAKRLENAAAAAGFAMVNPDDFAGESMRLVEKEAAPKPDAQDRPATWSWLNWDYLRLTGGKATA